MMSIPLTGDLARFLTIADQQRLVAVLAELPPPSRGPIIHCMQATAVFDNRPLPALIPLFGPPLRAFRPKLFSLRLNGLCRLPKRVLPLSCHSFVPWGESTMKRE